MKVELLEQERLKRTIEVEVSPEETAKAVNQAYDELRRRVRLPGFRQGRIPRSILEVHFGKELQANVRERLLQEGLREAIGQLQLDLASSPSLAQEGDLIPGQPFRFTLDLEIKPKINLKPLENYQIEDDSDTSVSEDEVQAMLSFLQKANAPYAPLEPHSKPQAEDMVRLKGLCQSDGGEGYEIEIEGVLDGQGQVVVDPNMPPLKPNLPWDGEGEFVIMGHLPHVPEIPEVLRGKPGKLEMRLVQAQRKQPAPLDDEFAKDFGASSVEELKTRVKEDLRRQKTARAKEGLKQKVAEALLQDHEIELPQGVVEEAMRRQLETLRNEGKAKDIDETKVREWVERQIKWHYLSEALIHQGGIQVQDAEVEAFLKSRFADKSMAFPPSFRDEARRILLEEKLYDFLLANVTLKKGGQS